MISPAEQKIIQIDITNACTHRCSNCTRFVGHRKPYFMPLAQVKKAIDSLRDFPRMVGIMGGEPTLHPDFEAIVEYLNEARPEKPHGDRYEPYDFRRYRNDRLGDVGQKKGLWSSLGEKYVQHFETIQNTFRYQCINDHGHEGKHMALLIPRTELGIGDREWIKYRDACWVQRLWSASITPKGAFFCEVAGALDLLFDGPGGWPVEAGWWRRKPEDFGGQLRWCEFCSACLPVPHRRANEGIDDVSPRMYERLKGMGSKKPMNVVKNLQGKANQAPEPYLEGGSQDCRVSNLRTVKKIDVVLVCVGYDDYLAETLPFIAHKVDSVQVVTSPEDTKTQELCEFYGMEPVISHRLHEKGAAFAKGKAINDGINAIENPDWILVLDADIILPEAIEALYQMTLNPGALYYTRRWGPRSINLVPLALQAIRSGEPWDQIRSQWGSKEKAKFTGRKGNAEEQFPFGYFQLFNVRAKALRGRKAIYPDRSRTAEHDDLEMGAKVFEGRTVCLPVPMFDVIHLPHGMFQENWSGRATPRLEDVKENPEAFSPRRVKWVCVKKCQYNGVVWEPGQTLQTEDFDVPKHFRRSQ